MTSTKPLALCLTDVFKQYGDHVALDGVSLNVPEGSIFGLLGPNGAGKTTLIRMVAGITAPDSGRVEFYGSNLIDEDLNNIGYLPEERGLYKNMRVGEQALYFAQLRGMDYHEAKSELTTWFERLEVDGWWDREVSDLSKGMAQKVQFIVSILHKPKFLILDEPLSGFDPINAARIKTEIKRLRDENGTTVLLSTHDMSSVDELCDHVALVNQGKKILEGEVSTLRENARAGRIDFKFRGNLIAFTAALGASAILHSVHSYGDNVNEMVLGIPTNTPIEKFLKWATSEVDVLSCSPRKISMDEVFLRAVNKAKR
ncbi:MAG: ABC transporter ATP-binding protein [Crocinitomicaceae bacterium]|nr:ABC transporter ATP-binding protein [Crocinitomicaceae bacterium]|tara:strand:- start:477 stop:1418 length:942 start_codon:yes stop_codon:yes gene_type:complete